MARDFGLAEKIPVCAIAARLCVGIIKALHEKNGSGGAMTDLSREEAERLADLYLDEWGIGYRHYKYAHLG